MLPEGWKECALETVAEVRSGLAISQKKIEHPVSLPYLRVANVQSGKIDLSEVKNITIERKDIERFSLKYGDVLLTEGGDFDKLGRGGIWYSEISPCLHQNHVFAVRLRRDVIPEFFAWQTESFHGRVYFLSCAKRSTNLASINSTQLKHFPVLVPPLPEQQKIAEILTAWDKAISTTDALVENSRQQKKALMQQLLTGKKRLAGFSGEWKTTNLGEVANIEKGKALNGNSIHVGKYPVIAGGKTISVWHNSYTHENVITISASGAYAGFVSLHKRKIWASDCSTLSQRNNISLLDFLYQYMLYNQSIVYSLQTGGAQPHIYPKDIVALKIALPPLPEQRAIAAVLTAADREIALLEQKAAGLREEKKALMQQLLTGKKRVQLLGK